MMARLSCCHIATASTPLLAIRTLSQPSLLSCFNPTSWLMALSSARMMRVSFAAGGKTALAPLRYFSAALVPSTGKDAAVCRANGSLNQKVCLLYTSDAADDLLCVDLGGRRIIKKKK